MINNGGPAFPGRVYESRDFSLGMSLRDYLAARAMAELLQARCRHAAKDDGLAPYVGLELKEGDELSEAECVAEQAYIMADAMIEAGRIEDAES